MESKFLTILGKCEIWMECKSVGIKTIIGKRIGDEFNSVGYLWKASLKKMVGDS